VSRLKRIFSRLKRRHPDVYAVLRKYCDERGMSIEDVVAAAVATWLASDEEAKKDLEEAMAARSRAHGSSPDIREAVSMFREMCGAMGDMFKAMAEARSSLTVTSIVEEYRAISNAAREIKSMGESGGEGSVDSIVARMFLERLLGIGPSQSAPRGKRKTGSAEVEKVEE
jgi:hypothetical protein